MPLPSSVTPPNPIPSWNQDSCAARLWSGGAFWTEVQGEWRRVAGCMGCAIRGRSRPRSSPRTDGRVGFPHRYDSVLTQEQTVLPGAEPLAGGVANVPSNPHGTPWSVCGN